MHIMMIHSLFSTGVYSAHHNVVSAGQQVMSVVCRFILCNFFICDWNCNCAFKQ